MPQKKPGPRKQVNFRMSESTKRRLARIAKAEGLTMTDMISKLIRTFPA